MKEVICGYYLDSQQRNIVMDESKNLLVVAGAGSGKTLTIMGKIYYLVKYKNINPSEILCISFTKASSSNLKEKIKREFNYNIPVYTFHKLALEIFNENNVDYQIAESDILDNIIENFFNNIILNSSIHMEMVLKYFGIYFVKDIKSSYLKMLNYNHEQIKLLSNLILSFIHLFKCNNYKIYQFNTFLQQAKMTMNYFKYKREKIFLTITMNIYLMYEKYLEENKEIDFDDMIIEATEMVREKGIKSMYKYVIIDEYQDTSYIRFCLIKNILEKTEARLMVVGDDFQSIYRFTGCDLSLFLNFNSYFSETKIMKIETTYRNSQELITVAGNFVMKNKKQIKKNLVSDKHLLKPIKVVYCDSIKDKFLNLVLQIYNDTYKPILVLGRNNRDISLILGNDFKLAQDGKIKYLKNEDIKIRFLTVHKAKGLEEENVIIINLTNNILGFPNQLKDDKVLRFVNKNEDKFLYSEERRLFYVALTRTKGYVYLMTQKNNSSIFLEELLRDYRKYIDVLEY